MKKRDRILALLLCLVMAVSLAGCGKSKNAQAVDDLISAIGPVTAESVSEVEDAESAYAALTDKEKEQVEHFADLTSARRALDRALKIRAVEDAIADLGTITVDSKAALDAIEAALSDLPQAEQALLRDSPLLTKARTAYEEAVRAAELQAKREALLGSWYWDQDVTDIFLASMENELKNSPDMAGLTVDAGKYFDECFIRATMELREDGTYRLFCDEADVRGTVAAIKPGIVAMVRDVLVQALAKQLAQIGVSDDLSTPEKMEEFLVKSLGKSLDEVVRDSLGMDLEDYIDKLLEEALGDSLQSSLQAANQEGIFAVDFDEGKLYLSDDGGSEINPESCELFRLGDGTLEIVGHVGKGQFEGMYPISMTRLG